MMLQVLGMETKVYPSLPQVSASILQFSIGYKKIYRLSDKQ